MPHEGRNPPTSKEGNKILDKDVEAMLKKGAINIEDLSVDGVILGFFARPKKTIGKVCQIVSMKCTNSLVIY